MEAILKSGNSGKELVCDSVFLSQLYFTDLASEMLAFGKGIICYNSFITITMFLLSWFEWPYCMCFVLTSLQRNPSSGNMSGLVPCNASPSVIRPCKW